MRIEQPAGTACTVLGILDDGWAGLGERSRMLLAAASLVCGASRTLALVRAHLPPTCELRAIDAALAELPAWIEEALANGRRVAVLATGDPLCHGIGSVLMGKLGRKRIDIVPAPSTLQVAMARFGKAWHDVCIASCHARDAGEWTFGATPEHGLYALMRAIARHPRVFAFTSPENGPARLARALLSAGYGGEARLSVACCLLQPDEAVFVDLLPELAAAMHFAAPSVALVERAALADEAPVFGFADDEYTQRRPESGLLTKLEVRAVSLAKLALQPDSLVWDIGAGAGSVGIEAARLAPFGHVWAIEKNEADAANALANARRFRVGNYTLCVGKAPAGISAWPDPHAVFVGGSGGELAELIDIAYRRLRANGRLVINLVTLENLALACEVLKRSEAAWEVVQLSASRSQPILGMHRLAAQNSVWIVTASKNSQ